MITQRLYSYFCYDFLLIREFVYTFRRFWTRNRSGDTVLERSEEGLLMHATRMEQLQREELEHERSIEMNMPGLGFEGGLLEQLQQQHQSKFILNI